MTVCSVTCIAVCQVLASHEVTVFSDGSESTFRAMFQEPLEVEPAVQYIASVTLKVNTGGAGRRPWRLCRPPSQSHCPAPNRSAP